MKETKHAIIKIVKKAFQLATQYKKKLKNAGYEDEVEDIEWEEDDIENYQTNWKTENLEDMTTKLKKVYKLLEKNLVKLENFNKAKTQFIEVGIESTYLWFLSLLVGV